MVVNHHKQLPLLKTLQMRKKNIILITIFKGPGIKRKYEDAGKRRMKVS